MKNLFILLLISSAAISGCSECDHGYGPDDCSSTWASFYVGNHEGSSTCCPGVQVLLTISELGADELRFDDRFTAVLTEWDQFNVSEQTYQNIVSGNNITVSGTGLLEVEQITNPSGQVTGKAYTLRMNMKYVTQGNTYNELETYEW